MSNLPNIEFKNLFEIDPTGQKLLSYWLGEKTFLKFKPRFLAMGAAGANATPLSQTVDKSPPTLYNFSPQGLRIDQIDYHPAYTELKKLSYEQEIVSLKYNKAFLNEHKMDRHTLGFSIAYYFAQTETGLFCPICMTDALGRVMERHNQLPQTQKTLEHISSSNLSTLWEGAMFLTEKQGGSDVGTNTTSAENVNGRWFLSGDKWFCSNADAKAILALARMPGDEGSIDKGTRGLGLFLILRDDPTNNSLSWTTHRLKNKLGVKSMASGEITLHKTEAFLIGGAGHGFKIMTEMVNMSRIYNAVASLGIVRRSLIEAKAFGDNRLAFDKKLTDLPLWRSSLSDLVAEHLSLMFIVFEATRQLDLSDNDHAEGSSLMRLITPLAKGLGGKLSVFAASEAMELIGGNAYIEEHILPRLLRDAQVLPIWEGTTNIQSLDFIRALQKEGPKSLFDRCDIAIKKSNSSKELITQVTLRLEEIKKQIETIPQMAADDVQRESRKILENAGRTLSLCLLLEATREPQLKNLVESAVTRLLARPSPTSALGGFQATELKSTETVLLDSIL